ncbi:MAG: AmmeMemoRadiSam system protein A [Candidatus Nealsonbacteria bacterium]
MNPYVLLAKEAVENYIGDRKVIESPKDLPKEFFERKAGVFVTIEKEGRLRGCIGTYLPVRDNIAEEIIHNAIAAATEDYRFGAIKKTELPRLSYSVYLLNKPEKISDIAELDPKKFGIIVKAGEKSGLLLPDLEGVNTVAEQISICCQKGGIMLKQENVEIYKFTVEKYEED